MTYAVGLLVDEGLAMIADTRTNAGVDNISSYKKLHVVEVPGERSLALATAGSLSLTQMAQAMVDEGIVMPGSETPETLYTVPSMFRAAQLVGHAVRMVRSEIAPILEAENIAVDASVLLGGQIGDQPMALYLIYSQGNFIECGADTPYLQIGEFKYGKPILDRALGSDTPLADALKLGLISFDSTTRSNIAVGLPFDAMVLPRRQLRATQRRIGVDDPYFRELGRRWSDAIAEAHRSIPVPDWLSD